MDKLYGYIKEKNYILKNFKKNSLSHSIIFSGQKGIGKNTFVFNLLYEIFIFLVNGNNITHHLNLIKNNTHPNIKYLTRDYDDKLKKNKNYITINQIRNLNNFIHESTFDGLPKFIIIDSADDLNINASNSLLKILEEPKNDIYFFLISHQISSLLLTIRSRCLKIKFKKHDFESFKLILSNKIEIDNHESFKFLFDLSNGSPGIAIEMQDEDISVFFKDILSSLIYKETFCKENIEFSLKVSELNNDKFKIFLSVLKFVLINLNKVKLGINIFNQFLSKELNALIHTSNKISESTIFNKLEYLIKNENDLFDYNLDKKIFILNFLAVVDN